MSGTSIHRDIRILVGLLVFGTTTLLAGQGNSSLGKELAEARAATAQYHRVADAIADGYQDIGLCEENEGCHFVNFDLIDGVFDAAHPEVLLYALSPSGHLRLAGVEYVIPLALSQEAPEGFTGSADEWREDSEGLGLWEMTAWLWVSNPDGMFAARNPRLP